MTSLPPPQDICQLAESRQLWQVDPKSDHCTELSEYETIREFLSRYCRFSLGARTGICFNDFNQDILLTHTQELRVLEINRGFCLLQPCVAEVVGWVFSASQRDSKHFGLPLLSPALPFGFCPPAIIWTIPVYGSSKIIKQYHAHRVLQATCSVSPLEDDTEMCQNSTGTRFPLLFEPVFWSRFLGLLLCAELRQLLSVHQTPKKGITGKGDRGIQGCSEEEIS